MRNVRIKVLVADDQAMVRSGFASWSAELGTAVVVEGNHAGAVILVEAAGFALWTPSMRVRPFSRPVSGVRR